MCITEFQVQSVDQVGTICCQAGALLCLWMEEGVSPYSVQYTVQCAVCSVQCAVCSALFGMCSLKCGYISLEFIVFSVHGRV